MRLRRASRPRYIASSLGARAAMDRIEPCSILKACNPFLYRFPHVQEQTPVCTVWQKPLAHRQQSAGSQWRSRRKIGCARLALELLAGCVMIRKSEKRWLLGIERSGMGNSASSFGEADACFPGSALNRFRVNADNQSSTDVPPVSLLWHLNLFEGWHV